MPGSAAAARCWPPTPRCSSVLSAGVATLGADVRKFALAFTAVFAIAYASWIVGSYAYIAAVTPAEQRNSGSPGR